MTSHPFRSDRAPRLRQGRLLLTSALALAMSALPVSISTDTPLLGWQSAVARGDGGGSNGGGHGGGGAGGHGPGGNGEAHGRGIADQARAKHGPQHPGADGRGHAGGGYRDATEFMDSVRSGRAFGLERRDARVAAAQERYQAALGDRRGRPGLGPDRVGAVAHQFAPEETSALIGRGWKGPTARAAGFRSHGGRVRTGRAVQAARLRRPGRRAAGELRHAVRKRHRRAPGAAGRRPGCRR